MNKSESKYCNTAVCMDEAFLELLEKKDFEYIAVKEICEKAGVNRSTFYLHYETVGDLLSECVEYTNRRCFERYKQDDIKPRLSDVDLKELVFITPEYLQPYFEFVKENKRLFKIAISRPSALEADKTFSTMFHDIFSPVLDRFHYPNDRKKYVISFYVSGLIAIVSEWIKNDCTDPIEKIIDICISCIMPNGIDAYFPRTQKMSEVGDTTEREALNESGNI